MVLAGVLASPVAAQTVVDGDTIAIDGTCWRLRGVDAPETHQPVAMAGRLGPDHMPLCCLRRLKEEANEFGECLRAGLDHDVCPVKLHCSRTNAHRLGHLLVRISRNELA